ncbi:bZIP transcription factor 17 [Macadamia integrifolia]|uniref:bZIP transcription factor 17 n=1 Tax=Macadamia integrifolia TaxID=60698 RepID=UPI001C52F4EA|nr:bZIP transcription factor 17 [Macadamia integrifolia]
MACQEPTMCGSLPATDLANPNLPADYDPLPLPPLDYDYFDDDLNLPEDFAANLGFDGDLGDIDFTLDDLILPPEDEGYVTGDRSDSLSWQNSKATDGSGVSSSSGGFDVAAILNSPSPETGSCNRGFSCAVSSEEFGGCGSGGEKGLNSLSPDSGCCDGGQSGCISSSPNSSNNTSDIVVDQKIKSEEVANGYLAKRKKAKEDCNTDPRSSKFRRSENVNSVLSNGTLDEEEEKKKARLMRNRESAQLSRQRKKHYVEELEDKIRSMHSTIAELNSKVSFFMVENTSLRQQLSGGGICPPPSGIYPPPPMAPMAYAWVPYASYPVKPQGSQVPLVPIPKLKPQQSTTKAKKIESKKGETKTKKVASVSLLGVLFFMFLFGFLVPFVNVRYGVNEEAAVNSGLQFSSNGVYGNHQGRVLTVMGRGNKSDPDVGVRLSTKKSYLTGVDGKSSRYKRDGSEGVDSEVKQNLGESQNLPLRNASEPLTASLYVPRNDKLVKIDGNLIIHSVLASEKAMKSSHASSELKRDKATVSPAREARETGLAIAGKLPPVYGVAQAGRNSERHHHSFRNQNDRRRALASGSGDTYKDNSKLSSADGSLQQWFREGLAGPVLSSGVCTEVFQFNISPASVNAAAIVPVTSVANATTANPPHSGKRKNRRILDRSTIPLARSSQNKTEEHVGRNSSGGNFEGNKSVSPLVVSVLVDPREASDVDGDGVISSKSLSRIFVVVLADSVKYVTYSCVLPLKGSGPHLVTT